MGNLLIVVMIISIITVPIGSVMFDNHPRLVILSIVLIFVLSRVVRFEKTDGKTNNRYTKRIFKRRQLSPTNVKQKANIPSTKGRLGHRQPIPTKVKREVWRRDFGKCVNCGTNEKLEYDHIIPVSKGGANTVVKVVFL